MSTITRKQAMELSGVKGQTIDYWRQRGYIKAIKINNKWHYDEKSFLNHLEKRDFSINERQDKKENNIYCYMTKKKTEYKDLSSFQRKHRLSLRKELLNGNSN